VVIELKDGAVAVLHACGRHVEAAGGVVVSGCRKGDVVDRALWNEPTAVSHATRRKVLSVEGGKKPLFVCGFTRIAGGADADMV